MARREEWILDSSSEVWDLIFLRCALWVGVGVLSDEPWCLSLAVLPRRCEGGTRLLGLAGADLSSLS